MNKERGAAAVHFQLTQHNVKRKPEQTSHHRTATSVHECMLCRKAFPVKFRELERYNKLKQLKDCPGCSWRVVNKPTVYSIKQVIFACSRESSRVPEERVGGAAMQFMLTQQL